ncbi:MAG: aminopeptidase P family protein [Lachnospiraceae bacterium]|nr:aminopeptidase P family protein [Lachnospiraceae bacterium]
MLKLDKTKDIAPLREQCMVMDRQLGIRISRILPALMEECGLDMWIVLCREYNEDPVFRALVPYRVKNASRTSCLVFTLDKDGTFGAYNFGRPDPRLSPYYEHMHFPSKGQDQFESLREFIALKKPLRAAVNCSGVSAMADGLSKTMWDKLEKCLGSIVPVESDIAIRLLETRTDEELELYREAYRITTDILAEAYSPEVIRPGITTTADVEWFIAQRINDMGLVAWFSPDVDLQRKGLDEQRTADTVIQKGDLLHTDMGLVYYGLHTDMQRLAYVLNDGEEQIPEGLLRGHSNCRRFQDIVCGRIRAGRSGNEVFHSAVEEAVRAGLSPMLYSHPVGLYGHAAGPMIGLYDCQGDVPGTGELLIHDKTCYALELNTTESVPEWDGQKVCFMLEETILFHNGRVSFAGEGRDRITLIRG